MTPKDHGTRAPQEVETKPSRRGVGLKRKMRSSWSFQVEDLLRNQISFKDHLIISRVESSGSRLLRVTDGFPEFCSAIFGH